MSIVHILQLQSVVLYGVNMVRMNCNIITRKVLTKISDDAIESHKTYRGAFLKIISWINLLFWFERRVFGRVICFWKRNYTVVRWKEQSSIRARVKILKTTWNVWPASLSCSVMIIPFFWKNREEKQSSIRASVKICKTTWNVWLICNRPVYLVASWLFLFFGKIGRKAVEYSGAWKLYKTTWNMWLICDRPVYLVASWFFVNIHEKNVTFFEYHKTMRKMHLFVRHKK